jgi:hypothetical protein
MSYNIFYLGIYLSQIFLFFGALYYAYQLLYNYRDDHDLRQVLSFQNESILLREPITISDNQKIFIPPVKHKTTVLTDMAAFMMDNLNSEF